MHHADQGPLRFQPHDLALLPSLHLNLNYLKQAQKRLTIWTPLPPRASLALRASQLLTLPQALELAEALTLAQVLTLAKVRSFR